MFANRLARNMWCGFSSNVLTEVLKWMKMKMPRHCQSVNNSAIIRCKLWTWAVHSFYVFTRFEQSMEYHQHYYTHTHCIHYVSIFTWRFLDYEHPLGRCRNTHLDTFVVENSLCSFFFLGGDLGSPRTTLLFKGQICSGWWKHPWWCSPGKKLCACICYIWYVTIMLL